MTQPNRATVIDGGLTDNIRIDFTKIPGHVKEDLAAATMESVKAFLRQPGGKEMLDARIAAKKERSKTNENRKDLTGNGGRA